MNPEFWITDEASIGRVATSADERRLALNACLLVWNAEDIGVLQRVDATDPEWHGWTMNLWRKD